MIEKVYKEKRAVSKKNREDRTLNTILYCNTARCAETFDETSKLEEHILPGKNIIAEEISTPDQVKKSFTERMKLTSKQYHPTSS